MPKPVIYFVAGAFLLLIFSWVYQSIWQIGYQRAQSEYQQSAIVAQAAAHEKERQYYEQIQAAQKTASETQNIIRADVDSIRTERDRLRRLLAATQRDLSSATAATSHKHASAISDILESCARELEVVARAADGHAADSVMLQSAWPKSQK